MRSDEASRGLVHARPSSAALCMAFGVIQRRKCSRRHVWALHKFRYSYVQEIRDVVCSLVQSLSWSDSASEPHHQRRPSACND
ncbi:unnamed protein product [Urochloa humidicola]